VPPAGRTVASAGAVVVWPGTSAPPVSEAVSGVVVVTVGAPVGSVGVGDDDTCGANGVFVSKAENEPSSPSFACGGTSVSAKSPFEARPDEGAPATFGSAPPPLGPGS